MAPLQKVAAILGVFSLLAGRLWAGESELSASTEFGITVTPDEVYAAIEESSDYWPPVGRHVAGDQFPVADVAMRQQTAAFISEVNQTLHDRLFGDDEAAAQDVIVYLQARLRVFVCYRRLRETLADDPALVALKDQWEEQHRELYLIPQPERSILAAQAPGSMRGEMARLGVPEDRIEAALPIWKQLAACEARRDKTAAGALMLEYERRVMSGNVDQAELIRRVIGAADWSLIAKAEGKIASKRDFLQAWEALEGYRVARR